MLFSGLISVTSADGVGKTAFCVFNGDPFDQIAFVDDDPKNAQMVQELKERGKQFGLYIPFIAETRGMKEVALHEHALQVIERVKAAGLPVLIWDTWTRFENSFHPYVVKYASKFKEAYSPKGDIKGAEQWIASFDYETQVIDDLLRSVRTMFVTTHARQDSKVRTLMKTEGKRPLGQRAVLRVWLTQADDNSPVPTGLLLKRPLQIGEDETGMPIPVNVFPRKIKHINWARMREFWKQPIGDRAMTSEETPNAWELSILDGVLTEEQKLSMRLNVLDEEKEAAELSSLPVFGKPVPEVDPQTYATQLRAEGFGYVKIFSEMKAAGYAVQLLETELESWLEAAS